MTRRRAGLPWLLVPLAALLAVFALGVPRRSSESVRAPEPPPKRATRSEPPPEPVAAAPSAAAPSDVECELSAPISEFVKVDVVEVDPDSLAELATHEAEVVKGWIRFTPRNPIGLGQVRVARHQPVSVAWVGGACLDTVELVRLPFREIRGRAVGRIETGAVAIQARCGEGATDPARELAAADWSGAIGEDGAFRLEVPTDQGGCAARVTRVFGGRDLVGPWIALRDRPELAVPVPGGVGWGLLEIDGGLRVIGVEPGLAADAAGLEMGDVVVSVDGDPADDLVADELAEAAGPLALEVVRDGVKRGVRLR